MKKDSLFLVTIAYVAFVMLGMWDGLIGVAWPSLRESFGQTNESFGLLVLFSASGGMAASFLVGALIRRIGLNYVLILSSVCAVVSLATRATTGSWLLFAGIGLMFGINMGLMDAGMNTYAALYFRPRLLNWLHASFALGTTLGSLLMTAVINASFDGDNWRVGIGIVAALQVAMLAVFVATRNRWTLSKNADSESTDQPEVPAATNRETLGIWRFWLTAIIFFIYVGVELGVGSWAFTLMTEGRNLDTTTAGVWTSVYWGSFLAGRVILGFIETNLNRLVRLATVGMLLGVLLFAIDGMPILNLIGLVLTGFAIAPIFPALIALTPERLGERHATNAVGFQVGAAGVGVALMPGLIGIIAEQFGVQMIGPSLVVIAIIMIVLHELLVRSGNEPHPT